MFNREQEQIRSFFGRTDQSAQDAAILARAEFYTDLHKKVSGGLISIADAEEAVNLYNHPPKFNPQPTFSSFLSKSREIPLLKPALITK
ncbi:MAG: hypothetical protein Q7R97_00590 [Candidatus Daviesbacteria bacterium]|nr:hypothetical protein [Candidatus Daviesbacteria bacterium]